MLAPIAICLLSEILPGLASAFLLHAIPLTFVSESGIYLAILFYLFIFLTSRDLRNGISVQFWSRKSGFEKKRRLEFFVIHVRQMCPKSETATYRYLEILVARLSLEKKLCLDVFETKEKCKFPKNKLFAAIETIILRRLSSCLFWAKSSTKWPMATNSLLVCEGKLITFC